MTDEQKRQVSEMYLNGWSPGDIADELGIDEVTVMDYCNYSELLD